MKKYLNNIRTLAALLMAMAAIVACSSTDDIAENNQQPVEDPTAPKVYTLTIQAGKGDAATTRALELSADGMTLNAIWEEGDKVYVFNEADGDNFERMGDAGVLTATNVSADGLTCTLTGTLTGTILPDDELYLDNRKDGRWNMQSGTLAYISDHLDTSDCYVKVETVGANNAITIEGGYANFENSFCILRFHLVDKSTGEPLKPIAFTYTAAYGANKDPITIEINGLTDAIYAANAYEENNGDGVLYLITSPGKASDKVSMTATMADCNVYTYSKSGVTFETGKFYDITVKMTRTQTYNLSEATANITLKNGDTATGTLAGNVKISIADGATVTLSGVSINADCAWNNGNNAGITCIGDATIILADGKTNVVNGFNYKYPGIYVPGDPDNPSNNKTLTIKGNGTLNASTIIVTHGDSGAGIGGCANIHCGNIIIEGGTINARGGNGATGIGGGSNASCGNITITGGNITALGGIYAAGIGSGAGTGGAIGRCGDIVITGGTIAATGGDASAGIGGGKTCGNITISGASITATKGYNAPYSIGEGKNADCGTVTINGVVGPISTSPYKFPAI